MTETASIGDLELAALISSRICHDVISPVGAIANGLEMLDEEQDQAMREQAMALIRKSAYQASAKLQFARLAFGAAGSAAPRSTSAMPSGWPATSCKAQSTR
jgi:histidine phosphotransferase ChpT